MNIDSSLDRDHDISAFKDGTWAELLVDAVIQSWHKGEQQPCARRILDDNPALADHVEAAVRLIFEDYCCRRAAGLPISAEHLLCSFPEWRAQLELMLQLHSLLELEPCEPEWPAVGDELGDFRLVAEFDPGSHGRVFLATQAGLADRPVVLKVTSQQGDEHLALARLQHTHVVSLLTVCEDAKRHLRVLCMPYFGGAPLHDLLKAMPSTPPAGRRGQDILDALDRLQNRWPIPVSPGGPARKLLARLSYQRAVCWIGSCLADALQYAHERGLIHLDVKPSNVLLAADGQPMLLDFHMARSPLALDGPAPQRLGGTPADASPEQRMAMEQIRHGKPISIAVDGRSDVYSLGLLLFETLGGQVPHMRESLPLQPGLAHVAPGLVDILTRCLAPDPRQRYSSAAALADDLRRQLNDLPLRGVPNRSLLEKWSKWRMRSPASLGLAILGGATVAAAVALAVLTLGFYRQQLQEAESALAAGRHHLQRGAPAEAVDRLSRGLAVARHLPWSAALTQDLTRELDVARCGEAARQLHELADRFRFLCGANSAMCDLRSLQPLWQLAWERFPALVPEDNEQLRRDVLDLGLIWAELHMRHASTSNRDQVCRDGMKLLNEIEKLVGPSGALCRQREACAKVLGLTEVALTAQNQAAELPPRGAWAHYVLGRTLLQCGDLEQAAGALSRSLELEPQAFWARYCQGICSHRLGRFSESATAFEVCVALAPLKAEPYCNRGLTWAALGRPDLALRDYNQALALNPRLAAAALNRGLLHYKQKRYPEAAADLSRALECGAEPGTVHYHRALVFVGRKDLPAALASVRLALAADPANQDARNLRANLELTTR